LVVANKLLEVDFLLRDPSSGLQALGLAFTAVYLEVVGNKHFVFGVVAVHVIFVREVSETLSFGMLGLLTLLYVAGLLGLNGLAVGPVARRRIVLEI
jgi:hypothetical protein